VPKMKKLVFFKSNYKTKASIQATTIRLESAIQYQTINHFPSHLEIPFRQTIQTVIKRCWEKARRAKLNFMV